jgi:hypothetical protein
MPNIIHLLTGYEGNNTFIVPKVPTICLDNAEENSWYRGNELLVAYRYVPLCISCVMIFFLITYIAVNSTDDDVNNSVLSSDNL